MVFKPHYDDSRDGVGWLELESQKEMLSEEIREGAGFELQAFVNLARVGEYRWFGVTKYVVWVC